MNITSKKMKVYGRPTKGPKSSVDVLFKDSKISINGMLSALIYKSNDMCLASLRVDDRTVQWFIVDNSIYDNIKKVSLQYSLKK
jgi:hypothetical protein